MAINTVLMDSLGCREEDVPATRAMFHQLEQAGIGPDQVSRKTFMVCARLAIREEVQSGHLPEGEAVGRYEQIHDRAPVADQPFAS